MKLFLVSRLDDVDYDEFDAFVVSCETEEEARHTHPQYTASGGVGGFHEGAPPGGSWPVQPRDVKVEIIGKSTLGEKRVVLSSFNAG